MEASLNIASIFKPLFFGDLAKYRILVFYGGRGGGKTESIARFLTVKLLESPINVAVSRQTKLHNDISIKSVFRRIFREFGITIGLSNLIQLPNNSKLFFLGASEKTIEAVRSIDDISFFWLEEAHNIKEETITTLIPSIRGQDSQIIFSLNPQKSSDYIYQNFIKIQDSDYHKSIKVNYSENPYFPKVLQSDLLRDKEAMPRDLFLHIWEGYTLDINDFKVIDIEKIGFFDDGRKWQYSEVFLSADTAFSKKDSADYSVIGCFGVFQDEIHLLRVFKGRWDFNELLEISKTAYFWLSQNYKSPSVFLLEKKASGISLSQELKRLTRFPIKEVLPKTDKFSRVAEVLTDFEILRLPSNRENPINSWVDHFLTELKMFRGDLKHEHDDQVDMVCYALKYLKTNFTNWADF